MKKLYRFEIKGDNWPIIGSTIQIKNKEYIVIRWSLLKNKIVCIKPEKKK